MSGVTKRFDDLVALRNIDLKVGPGSIYGLVGSNGAGKTTLLKLLAGVYLQDEGEILINQEPVYENVKVKSGIAFIPDESSFFPTYSVKNMAVFYRKIYPTWNEERFQRLQEVFQVSMDKWIHRLSKGMQKQAAFWLALSTMPEVIILDEPLDGLDPVMRKQVKNLLIQDVAERGTSVIISSHNLRELEDLCDHIGIIHKGELLLDQELDELKIRLHKVQAAFPPGTPAERLVHPGLIYREERGSTTIFIIKGDREEITDHYMRCNPVILDMLAPTLEEIFIYEMGDAGYEIQNILV
ncbi:MAG: ABC transporter ATP-binding protein [Chitinophagales bacterium]